MKELAIYSHSSVITSLNICAAGRRAGGDQSFHLEREWTRSNKKKGGQKFSSIAFLHRGGLMQSRGKERLHVPLLFLPENGYKGFCVYTPR